MDLQILLNDSRKQFSPGETVTGTASWRVEKEPRTAELRLVWKTQGKGSEDSEVVSTVPFARPLAHDSRPFTLQLPDSPYSFSGQLISLIWGLELIVEPGDFCAREGITLAPGGREILLPRIQSA